MDFSHETPYADHPGGQPDPGRSNEYRDAPVVVPLRLDARRSKPYSCSHISARSSRRRRPHPVHWEAHRDAPRTTFPTIRQPYALAPLGRRFRQAALRRRRWERSGPRPGGRRQPQAGVRAFLVALLRNLTSLTDERRRLRARLNAINAGPIARLRRPVAVLKFGRTGARRPLEAGNCVTFGLVFRQLRRNPRHMRETWSQSND